jgi:hypothetical protein
VLFWWYCLAWCCCHMPCCIDTHCSSGMRWQHAVVPPQHRVARELLFGWLDITCSWACQPKSCLLDCLSLFLTVEPSPYNFWY